MSIYNLWDLVEVMKFQKHPWVYNYNSVWLVESYKIVSTITQVILSNSPRPSNIKQNELSLSLRSKSVIDIINHTKMVSPHSISYTKMTYALTMSKKIYKEMLIALHIQAAMRDKWRK